jgi:hypothetical protein
MTARPIVPENRRKSVCVAVTLGMITVIVLLIVGCTTAPNSENQSGTLAPSPVATPTLQSKPLYKVTITQLNTSHSELIRMDSDVYNQGEIIEFSISNEGPDTITCVGDITECRLFFKKNDSSWEELSRPVRAYYAPRPTQPASTDVHERSYMVPGRTPLNFHLITTNWAPGRYKIQSDCLKASREFILRDTASIIQK